MLRLWLRCVGGFCITLAVLTPRVVFGQGGGAISRAGWTLHFASSQETAGGNYAAVNVFDGNPATMWTGQWQGSVASPPHELQINLGSTYAVGGVRYLPRQDGSAVGRIDQYEVYVSNDGTTWGAAVAAGTFPNTASEQEVLFPVVTARYVQLRVLSEVSGYPYVAVAELTVLGAGNQPPNGAITAPTGNVTIAPGQSVTFAGTGSDPENAPLSYAWTFGAGGPAGSTGQNPGAVGFPTAGEYTVTFTVTAGGTPDPTPATRTVTVVGAGGSGAALLPQAGWTLQFASSQETVGGNYAAVNAFDGNPATMWTGQWLGTVAQPPHDLRINLGAPHSISGFRYVPRQDGWSVGRIEQYEFYVSADGAAWGAPVAMGAFPNSAAEQEVQFPATTGSFVRLRVLSEVNGYPYVAVAELRLLGTGGTGGTGGPPPPGNLFSVPKANWTVHFVDSEETSVGGWAATNAFDGNPASMWGTEWVSDSPPPPHQLQIDMGASYDVVGFRYLPRQDGVPTGRVADYRFYVSTDGVTWGSSVASGTFPNTGTEQERQFPAKTGRYIRFRAMNEVNGQPWTAVAELTALATGTPNGTNQPPVVSLTQVSAGPYVAPAAISLRAVAQDSDGTVTRVDFLSGSTLVASDASSPYDIAVPNLGAGTFPFVAVARDNSGNTTTSNTITITVSDPQLPGRAVFTPSSDHNTLVVRYVLAIFTAGSDPSVATPVATLNLGKPAVQNGECTVDVSALIAGLSPGTYIGVVSAEGNGGTAPSAPSPPFTR